MRVLFDENMDPELADHLPGHECVTAEQMGWRSIKNGEMLKLADGEFEAFVTLDKGIQYQQNLRGVGLRIAILWPGRPGIGHVLPLVPALSRFLEAAQRGDLQEIGPPDAG